MLVHVESLVLDEERPGRGDGVERRQEDYLVRWPSGLLKSMETSMEGAGPPSTGLRVRSTPSN